MESALNLCGAIKLLEKLNAAPNRSMDMNALCSILGYSDDQILALSKAINAVDRIVVIKKHCLALKEHLDLLNADEIYHLRRSRGRVEVAESLPSTNTSMAENLHNLVSGDVLAAEIQTAGRGRRGDKWHSSIGKQLTFSVSMFFEKEAQISLLSVLTGTAVCLGLEKFGIKGLMLKWPNDLYFKNKKVGGILIENHFLPNKVAAVIGIGINVYQADFGKLSREYTSLFDLQAVSGRRNLLMANILDSLYALFLDLSKESISSWLEEFDKRDFLKEKSIVASVGNQQILGIANGISSKGELKILDNGRVTLCQSAHVNIEGDSPKHNN